MKATFYYYSNGGINVVLESVTGREERRFVFYTLQEVKKRFAVGRRARCNTHEKDRFRKVCVPVDGILKKQNGGSPITTNKRKFFPAFVTRLA